MTYQPIAIKNIGLLISVMRLHNKAKTAYGAINMIKSTIFMMTSLRPVKRSTTGFIFLSISNRLSQKRWQRK